MASIPAGKSGDFRNQSRVITLKNKDSNKIAIKLTVKFSYVEKRIVLQDTLHYRHGLFKTLGQNGLTFPINTVQRILTELIILNAFGHPVEQW